MANIFSTLFGKKEKFKLGSLSKSLPKFSFPKIQPEERKKVEPVIKDVPSFAPRRETVERLTGKKFREPITREKIVSGIKKGLKEAPMNVLRTLGEGLQLFDKVSRGVVTAGKSVFGFGVEPKDVDLDKKDLLRRTIERRQGGRAEELRPIEKIKPLGEGLGTRAVQGFAFGIGEQKPKFLTGGDPQQEAIAEVVIPMLAAFLAPKPKIKTTSLQKFSKFSKQDVAKARNVLGVKKGASSKEIQIAFRNKTRVGKYRHPDLGGTKGGFQKLNLANQSLINKEAQTIVSDIASNIKQQVPKGRADIISRMIPKDNIIKRVIETQLRRKFTPSVVTQIMEQFELKDRPGFAKVPSVPEGKPIPTDIQPLVQEAKKFKSVEEFAQNIKTQESVMAFWKNQAEKSLIDINKGKTSVSKSPTGRGWIYDIGDGNKSPSPFSTKQKTIEYSNTERSEAIAYLKGDFVKNNTKGIKSFPSIQQLTEAFNQSATKPEGKAKVGTRAVPDDFGTKIKRFDPIGNVSVYKNLTVDKLPKTITDELAEKSKLWNNVINKDKIKVYRITPGEIEPGDFIFPTKQLALDYIKRNDHLKLEGVPIIAKIIDKSEYAVVKSDSVRVGDRYRKTPTPITSADQLIMAEGVYVPAKKTVAKPVFKEQVIKPVIKEVKQKIPTIIPPVKKTTGKVPETFEEAKEARFTNRDSELARTDNEVDALQKELKTALGAKIFSENVKDYDRAVQIYIDLKRNPSHIDKYYKELTSAQKKMVDLSQNLPPEVKAVADTITESYKKIGLEALDAEVIRNTIDNYAARIWDLEGKPGTFKKFGATTRHAKPRTFETILEGWSKGFKLKIEGATNNLGVLKKELVRTMADKEFIKNLSKIKTAEGEPLLTPKYLDGYNVIEHPNFKSWKHVGKADTAKVYSKNFFVDEDGNLFEKQALYAPKDIAKRLNNMLGKSKIAGIPGVDFITKYNAIIKAWILQTSFFHHIAFVRSYLFGTNNKKLRELNPIKAYKEGLESVRQENPIVMEGIENGLTLGLKQDWNEELLQEKTGIGRLLDKWKVSKVVKDAILNLRQQQADFLFGKFGAGLKAKAFYIEYRHAVAKNPTEDTKAIAKRVANLINDDFGGLNLERMERDPTLQHFFRLFALAPDWTESNIRTMVKAIKGGTKAEGKLYRRFWSGIFTKAIGLTVLANLIIASADEDDKETKGTLQRFIRNYKKSWKAGNSNWLKVDVSPIVKKFGLEDEVTRFFPIAGHFLDPLKFILHPIRSAHHKGSIVYKFFFDALSGTDWAGRRFTTTEELLGKDTEKGFYKTTRKGKYRKGDPKFGKLKGQTVVYDFAGGKQLEFNQLPSFILNQTKGWQPVQIQNLLNWWAGEMKGFDAVMSSIGAPVSRGYIKESKKTKKKAFVPGALSNTLKK